MSNATKPIASVPTESSIKKPSLVNRGVNFVKSHKKAAVTAAILTGLVVANAYAARSNANSVVLPQDLADVTLEA